MASNQSSKSLYQADEVFDFLLFKFKIETLFNGVLGLKLQQARNITDSNSSLKMTVDDVDHMRKGDTKSGVNKSEQNILKNKGAVSCGCLVVLKRSMQQTLDELAHVVSEHCDAMLSNSALVFCSK